MASEDRTFQCVVIAPTGKLLDCRSASVVFPAHDGQVGVLADHMPMFCKLGLGIMEVKAVGEGPQVAGPRLLLMDGGFAVVCANLLKVVSYDVVATGETKPEAIEHVRTALNKKLHVSTLSASECLHITRKLSLLDHLVELSAASHKAT